MYIAGSIVFAEKTVKMTKHISKKNLRSFHIYTQLSSV